MVTIIVDDGNASRLSSLGEAPLYALEVAERSDKHLVIQSHFRCNSESCQRILDIMLAIHRHQHILQPTLFATQPRRDHSRKA